MGKIHNFESEDPDLEPGSIADVQDILENRHEGCTLLHQFLYKGVMILEIQVKKPAPYTSRKSTAPNIITTTRRIMIVGHLAHDISRMFSCEVKIDKDNKKASSWGSNGFDFSKKSSLNYPAVHWCKGIAWKHNGITTNKEDTIKFRSKSVKELMGSISDKGKEWHELDLVALKVWAHESVITTS